MKEDCQGEESIPEIDDSDAALSENNEENKQNKEETEVKNANNPNSNETVKKSLRDMDFGEFMPDKSGNNKEDDEIVWHNKEKENQIEKHEEVNEDQNKNEEANTDLLDYEIKVQNWDEEKKKKKEKKKMEEGEESKKEEKTPIDRFLLLNAFFQLLADEAEVNVTLAGYFNKVFMSFYNKKLKEVSF